MDADWTDVGALDDLPDGKGRQVTVGDDAVAVVRLGDRVVALSDSCTHQGAMLHAGAVRAASPPSITCPFHGSVFSLDDGRVLRGPATRPVATYEVRLEDGHVFLRAAG